MANRIRPLKRANWTDEQFIAEESFFPEAWALDTEVLKSTSADLRPTYFVLYHDLGELELAKSVAPKYCNIDYRPV